MSSAVAGSPIGKLFRPQIPVWACEFTSRRLVVAGVNSRRTKISSKQIVDLPEGVVVGSSSEKNLADPQAALSAVRSTLTGAGFRGSEIVVVIPDDSARITFINAETMPSGREERDTFIRWKLKKNMPFDVDSAQMSYKILGPAEGGEAGTELLVALAPREIVQEYVGLLEQLNIHAGCVVPATMATLNLVNPGDGDTLFVKIAADSVTTTIFRNGRFRFYRRVAGIAPYDAVYPTILYYQDKLAGSGIDRVLMCADEEFDRNAADELQKQLEIPVAPLEPRNIEDTFKPALGALNFVWANSI